MAIDPLSTWKTTLAALPKTADNSWADNFANWYADRIAGITTDPSALVPTGFVFTFAKPIFKTQLLALTPTPSALAGITGFANAWETALNATTVVVAPGTFKPPSSPATIFSVVASTIIDPASIAAGKAKIIELVTAPPVDDAMNSQFPIKFRDATLLLTIIITGTNSATPTPSPLTVSNVPLV